MKIGVFDSGVGGLSVLKSLIGAKLFSEIIYYGDTARVPYGNKDKATITRFSLEAVEFFLPHKIDMLIVACNTASAYALDKMQKIAPFPVIGVVEAGILSLSNKIKNKKDSILIIATKATIKSGIYERKLRKMGYENITSLQTGLFVPLVEEGVFEGEVLESVMRHYFDSLNLSWGEGNSPLDLHSADLANRHKARTQSPLSLCRFTKNHESQTENPSVVDSASQNLGEKCRISHEVRKSFCYFWLLPKVESSLPYQPKSTKQGKFAESTADFAPKDDTQTPKFRSIIVGANGLSLGISIVVAIMLGIGAGVLMQKIFGVFWVLFLGVFWGIAAAVLNVYKVYKAELRDFEALANDPKYKH